MNHQNPHNSQNPNRYAIGVPVNKVKKRLASIEGRIKRLPEFKSDRRHPTLEKVAGTVKERLADLDEQRKQYITKLSNPAKRHDIAPVNLKERIAEYQQQSNRTNTRRTSRRTSNPYNVQPVDLRQRVANYQSQTAKHVPKINLKNPTVAGMQPLRLATPERAKELYNWQTLNVPRNTPNLDQTRHSNWKPPVSPFKGPHARFYTEEDRVAQERTAEVNNQSEMPPAVIPMVTKQRITDWEAAMARPKRRSIERRNMQSTLPALTVASPARAKELYNWASLPPDAQTSRNVTASQGARPKIAPIQGYAKFYKQNDNDNGAESSSSSRPSYKYGNRNRLAARPSNKHKDHGA